MSAGDAPRSLRSPLPASWTRAMHAAAAAGARAPAFVDPPGYARHRPETTLLFQLVEQHDPLCRHVHRQNMPLTGNGNR